MKRAAMSLSSTSSATILLILVVASLSVEIAAKRGCSAFGHSCYGGHGKRSYQEAADLDDAKNREGIQVDYDLGRSNGEIVAQVPSQGFNRHEPRMTNSLHDNPSWSLFIRKLLMPLRRPDAAYSEVQK